MSAIFKTCTTNSKITYSPDISGKIILEKESPVLTMPEYHVCYGVVDKLTGIATFVGGSIQSYDSLSKAQAGLIALTGYGRPKAPFNPTPHKKGLAPFKTATSRFNRGFSNLAQTNSTLDGLESSLRKKWKI